MARLVGIYLDAGLVRRDPAYLDALQGAVGLNNVTLIAPGRLSDELRRRNPLGGDRDARLRALSAQRLDGQPYIGEPDADGPQVGEYPGVEHAADDSTLREAIGLCRARGMTVWKSVTGWTTRHSMLCPSKADVAEWYAAAYGELARSYDVDGINVTRTRFPMFGVPRGLEFCACDDCRREAESLGYDVPRIVANLKGLPARLAKRSAAQLAALADAGIGALELGELLGGGPGLADWIALRADIVTRQMRRIAEGMRAVAGRRVIFGTDQHPPGVAVLVGQRYADVDQFADWVGPILSHADTFANRGFAAWATLLARAVPGLPEAAALKLVYRLTGYDGLGMPEDVASLGVGQPDGEYRAVPLAAMLERDLVKARQYAPPGLPSYPIVRGGLWPKETVARVVGFAERVGHDGVIYQGTEALTDYKPKG